jgi:hypothetical protein
VNLGMGSSTGGVYRNSSKETIFERLELMILASHISFQKQRAVEI